MPHPEPDQPRHARHRRGATRALICASVLATFAPISAAAQETQDFLGSDIPFNLRHSGGDAVTDRLHPELEPIGLRVANSWLALPAISTSIGYTSNVYGAAHNAVGDGFATVAPQVQLVSQWSRHMLEFSGEAALKRFFTQSARSETAFSVQSDGRYDLGTGGSNLVGLVHYQRGFEAQYEGDFPKDAAGTVEYHQMEAIARGTFVFNRARLVLNERLNDIRYNDTTSLLGGVIDQTYRNRTEYHSAARLEYAFNGDVAAFSEVSYVRDDYHTATPFQPLRSNHEVRVLVGVNGDLHHVVRAMLGLGYVKRSYDLAAYYPALSGFSFDARVQWLVTDLTTVNLQASRKVQDAITAASPGYFEDLAQVRIDHELLRYVLLFVEGTYERDRFAAITRRDEQVQLRAGATYSLGRHFKLMPSVWYIKRTSQGTPIGQDFSEVRGTVELFTQF